MDVVPYLGGVAVSLLSAPLYHIILEVVLVFLIVWLLLHKSYQPDDKVKLTEKEKEDLINEWIPDPLVVDVPRDHFALYRPYIDGKLGLNIVIDGIECSNFATLNFLGFVGHDDIEEKASEAISTYGVGSCGPRGFYGTFDVHLDLESKLAEFMNCEEAILYSYGFSTIASGIPAYAKRGDIIFCDQGVNFAIQKGLVASRSKVEFFKHNDMNDLERLLKIQAERDAQNPKKARVTRRFIVVEGIYLNSGQLCPLPELVALKWKYKVRIFIDESISFGVLGRNGRGITDHFGVDMIEIDMVSASLENSVASTGGFCCGRSFIVDHQRLMGLGYCFSASLPPLLAVAAIKALEIMKSEPDRFERLHRNTEFCYRQLQRLNYLNVSGCDVSPIFHLYIKSNNIDLTREMKESLLKEIVSEAINCGIALTQARYLEKEEVNLPEPSIRFVVTSEIEIDQIEKCVATVESISEMLLKSN